MTLSSATLRLPRRDGADWSRMETVPALEAILELLCEAGRGCAVDGGFRLLEQPLHDHPSKYPGHRADLTHGAEELLLLLLGEALDLVVNLGHALLFAR